jgi:transformation/transcription domain-associated protein
MLTWMSRIPRNELLKPYQAQIIDLALKLLQVENEENGLMCIKLLIDAIRTNKEASEAYIERFIELIKTLYANIKVLVEKELNTPNVSTATNPPPRTS